MADTSEFPLPDTSLALCDIDGTLIDGSYNITDSAIYAAVDEAQQAGWTLGLSSDTPYEGMVRFRNMFGMNGPIIAEKGSVVEWDGNLAYNLEEAELFMNAYATIREELIDSGTIIWEGNPVEAISQGIRLGEPGDTVVLMNRLRRCSLGLHPRQVDNTGNMVVDADVTDRIIGKVRPLYPAVPRLDEDLNHDYGLLIVADETVTKRRGSQQLVEVGGICGRFAMIGNSITDYVGDDIAMHYAVGNATPAFQVRANYVATGALTVGVTEILRKLTA